MMTLKLKSLVGCCFIIFIILIIIRLKGFGARSLSHRFMASSWELVVSTVTKFVTLAVRASVSEQSRMKTCATAVAFGLNQHHNVKVP